MDRDNDPAAGGRYEYDFKGCGIDIIDPWKQTP